MAKSGAPTTLAASTVLAQVSADLGLTNAQLRTSGTSAPVNAELARAMICKIAVSRSGLSTTETARLLGFRTKKSVQTLIERVDSGAYDTHAAVTGAGHSTAAELQSALETSVENAL